MKQVKMNNNDNGLDFKQFIQFQELVIKANPAQQIFMLEHLKHVLSQRREDKLVRESW